MIKEAKPRGVLEATNENVVFVNFHDDKKTNFKKFGLGRLFYTIHKYFIQTDDYKEYQNIDALDEDQLNERIEKLKLRANDVMLSNKIGGAFLGMVPIPFLRNLFIHKSAAEKVGQIFGINLKFRKEEKMKNNQNLYFDMKSIDEEQLKQPDAKELVIEAEKKSPKVHIQGEIARTAISCIPIVGQIMGAVYGGIFTDVYCKDLIEKCAQYYKENIKNIGNSYEQAIKYFEDGAKNN